MDQQIRSETERGGSRWASVVLVRRVWERFTEGWDRLPGEAARTWMRTLGMGTVLAGLLAVALSWTGQYLDQTGGLAWEPAFLQWLRDEAPLSFQAALYVGIPGSSMMALPLTLFAAGLAAWRYRPLHALSFIVGFVLFKIFVGIGWMVWDRARPTLVEDGLAVPQGLNAYPSGHVVQTVFVYGLLAYLWGQVSRSRLERLIALLLTLLLTGAVGLGRLRIGAHWPSDILAGVVLGAAWLVVVIVALRRAEGRPRPPENKRAARA